MAEPSDIDRELVDETLRYLSDWDAPERFNAIIARFKDRVRGSLGGIEHARIDDRLRALENQGAITPGATKAWKDIRNGSAHSYQAGKMKDDKFRKDFAALQVLFFHVFFHVIQYQGPYTDFSTRGWPTKIYPDDNVTTNPNEGGASPTPTTRVLGLDAGKVKIADDFNAPLPDELQGAFEDALG